jgi:hypothetical protein
VGVEEISGEREGFERSAPSNAGANLERVRGVPFPYTCEI